MIQNFNITNEGLAFELSEFLDKEEEKELGIDQNNYEITSLEAANYYIKKIKDLREDIDIIENTASSELKKQEERITKWATKRTSSINYMIDQYQSMLLDFWLKHGDSKTIKLSNGSLCMRKMRDKTEFDDKAVENFLVEQNLIDSFSVPTYNKASVKENLICENDNYYLNVDGKKYDMSGMITLIHQEPKFEVK